MSKLIKILAEFALLLLKLIRLVYLALSKTTKIAFTPFRFIIKIVYYQLFLPLYRVYLLALKKIGLTKSRQFNPIAAILVNKNFTHILLVLLAVIIIFQNSLASKNAVASEDIVGKTPLARLVSDELTDSEVIVEEYQ
jgi:hypothetical protein